VLLNLTTWRQVEPVLVQLLARWPTPEALKEARPSQLRLLLRPLGLANRRCVTLGRFARAFSEERWGEDAAALHGCGPYAADAYRMFVLGVFGDEPPADKELAKYWTWWMEQQAPEGAPRGAAEAAERQRPPRTARKRARTARTSAASRYFGNG